MHKSILFLLAFLVSCVFSDVLLDACKENNRGQVSIGRDLIAIDKPDNPPDAAQVSVTTIKEFALSPVLTLSIVTVSPSEQERMSGLGGSLYLCKKEKNGLRYFFLQSLEILDQKFEAKCAAAEVRKIETPSRKPVFQLELTETLDYIRANDQRQCTRTITDAFIFALPENGDIEMIACNIPVKTFLACDNNNIETSNELSITVTNGALVCKKASKTISDEQKGWLGTFPLNSTPRVDSVSGVTSQYKNALALYKSGKKSEAAQMLLKGVGPKPWTIDNSSVGKFNDLGFFLGEAGQFQDAVDVLATVIAKFPDRTPAYLNVADAYAGLKNSDKAKENYKKYIELMTKAGKQGKIPKRVTDSVR